MKRALSITIFVAILLGFFSPHPTIVSALDRNNVEINIDWGGADHKDPEDEASEVYIVDNNFEDGSYDIKGSRFEQNSILEAKLKIRPSIDIIFPEEVLVSELKFKFRIAVRSKHERCFGYKIKVDDVELSDLENECLAGGEEGHDTGDYWIEKLFDNQNAPIPINRKLKKLTMELEGYGRSSVWLQENEVNMEFNIWEVWPIVVPDETPPEINFLGDWPTRTIQISTGGESFSGEERFEITAQDTGSGLSETSAYCKLERFGIDVTGGPKPQDLASIFDTNVKAFAPGTKDPVPVVLSMNRLPVGARFVCGVWAQDLAGKTNYVTKRFKVVN